MRKPLDAASPRSFPRPGPREPPLRPAGSLSCGTRASPCLAGAVSRLRTYGDRSPPRVPPTLPLPTAALRFSNPCFASAPRSTSIRHRHLHGLGCLLFAPEPLTRRRRRLRSQGEDTTKSLTANGGEGILTLSSNRSWIAGIWRGR